MATIFLAEDDHSMRKFLRAALKKAGHTVDDAADGDEALEKIKVSPSGTYDLLLTDIVMPGMDGIELSQKITDYDPKIKVMFITGFAAMALAGKSETEHKRPTQILAKPFHLNELVTQVNTLLAA